MKTEQQSKERQPYVRPQLVKHGQVESLTLGSVGSTSRPQYCED